MGSSIDRLIFMGLFEGRNRLEEVGHLRSAFDGHILNKHLPLSVCFLAAMRQAAICSIMSFCHDVLPSHIYESNEESWLHTNGSETVSQNKDFLL
jgi:hypothetical protein